MNNSNEWRPRPVDGIRTEAVGDELILLDKQSKRVHQLDRVGARIFACCDGTTPVDDIVVTLLQEFDVSPDRLEHDVWELLERMRILKILQ